MTPEAPTLLLGVHVPLGVQRRALERRFPGSRRVLVGRSAAPERGFDVARGAERLALFGTRWARVIALQDYPKLLALAAMLRADERYLFDRGELIPWSGIIELEERALRRWRARYRSGAGYGNDYRSLLDVQSSEAPTVSVIIPVYNRNDALARTLAGLARQRYPANRMEVIVSDDGSQEDTAAVVSRFDAMLELESLWQPDEGFRAALARNRAIERATGEIICCLDSDMIPSPDWLQHVTRWFATEREVVVLGERRFIDAEGLEPQEILDVPSLLQELPAALGPEGARGTTPGLDWRTDQLTPIEHAYRHPQPYRLGVSCNMAFRRSLVRQTGGFDPAFRAWGGEDIELTFRLVRHGAYVVYDPEAVAYHQEHASAVAREDDRRITNALLGARVPAFRAACPEDPVHPELTLVVRQADAGELDRWRQDVRFVDLDVCCDLEERPDFPRVRSTHATASDIALLEACEGEHIAFLEGLPSADAPLAAACRQLRLDGDLSAVRIDEGLVILRVRDCFRFAPHRESHESLTHCVLRLGLAMTLERTAPSSPPMIGRAIDKVRGRIRRAVEERHERRRAQELQRAASVHGFWFVDIPRTSSSSIRSELGKHFGAAYAKTNVLERRHAAPQLGLDHATAAMMRDRFGAELWDRLFVFTVVRNPWERVFSMFNYRRKVQEIPSSWRLSDYVARLSEAGPGTPHFLHHSSRYGASEFILDEDGTVLVDYIVRFEDRRRGLEFVAEKIGAPSLGTLHLQRATASGDDYRAHYDPTAQDRVAKLYERDIRLFDYDF